MRLWLHMWGPGFLERKRILQWWEGSVPKAILLTPYYICNHESPNNSVHISPFVVKHCSRSLVFLVLRLQLLSWFFHCSVSTLLHGFCRWVLFLTVLLVHNSPWQFHFSAITFNGKMLQAAATWLLYFLRAKLLPGAQKSWQRKNALRIRVDCHVKWMVHTEARKKKRFLCPDNCIYQL